MYQKYERYTVEQLKPQLYQIKGEWKDDIHDLQTTLLIDILKFQIVDAKANGQGVPFAICHQGISKVKDMIGSDIGPGFSHTVKKNIMGPEGCTHLGELMLGSIKAFIHATARKVPSKNLEALYDAKWNEWMNHYSDGCIFFSQPGITREEIIEAITKAGKS